MEPLRKRIENQFCKMMSVRIIPQAFKRYRQIRKIAEECSGLAVVGMTEHIGDIVACEPVARFLAGQRNQKVVWIVNRKYSELLKYNPNIYALIEVSSLSDWIYLKRLLSCCHALPVYDLHLNLKICPQYRLQIKNKVRTDITPQNYYNEGPLLSIFCLVGGLPVLKTAPRFYLPPMEQRRPLNLPEKYIAIQTVSNDTIRCWDIKKWEKLVNHFRGYTFIELGTEPSLHCDNCISDYCGKISLSEAAQIIEGARLFIGIDSAFAHFANAFAKPGVILLGKFATFSYYMPYSGNFEDPGIATILHHSDIVGTLPADDVIRAVAAKLDAG